MSDMSLQVLQLINSGSTFLEIMKSLKINYCTLLSCITEIIDNDYKINKTVFSDGQVLLGLKNEIEEEKEHPNLININFNNEEEREFRALFISDLHTGSQNDRYDCVDKAANYAINNNINVIINLGDFVENTYTNRELRLQTLEEQIDYIVKYFPCDRRFIHISLYGNHDYHYVPNGGIDVASEIERRRPDIISAGYGRGYLKIGDDYVCIEHECPNRPGELLRTSNIKYIGHSHMYKLNNQYKKCIYVPALSDEIPSNYSIKPMKGFLDVSFCLNSDKLIQKITNKHFVYHYQYELASKFVLNFQRRRTKY